MNPWEDIARAISAATGAPFKSGHRTAVSGGDINTTFRLDGSGRSYFVKTGAPGQADMFVAEAAGLTEIAATRTIRVPQPVCHGANGAASWIVLEYLQLTRCSAVGMRTLGRQLAALHRVTAPAFGWHRDNTIGATPQINTQTGDWTAFWRERRLGYQLSLAARNGCGGKFLRDGERLMEKLSGVFGDHRPQPSLLHGDLWSGNAGCCEDGTPIIYDPAVYYGDRECDLAMTELFGGYPAEFYAAYRETYPLDAGYARRKPLYNLYHVLNHFNLFGGGYLGQAERMTRQLLAEL